MEFRDKELVFKWKTGSITIMRESVLSCSPAHLKKLINSATENREEVEAEISAVIRAEIAKYDPKTEAGKKAAEKYGKLLAVISGEKQGKREKIVAQVIKNNTRFDMQGVFEDGGKHCVIDGYRLLRFADPIPGFQKAAHSFDTVKALNQVINQDVTELSLPSAKDLRADIKLAKKAGYDCNGFGHIRIETRGRKIFVYYDFGYFLPMVDAEYLLSMLEALPDCKAYATESNSTPIYFVSGDNDGLLCPVRKDREYEEAPAEAVVYAPFPASKSTEAAENAPAIVAAIETAEDTAEPETNAQEAAETRVTAVAAAVKVSEEDNNILSGICRLFKRGLITEDEAKHLLAFPVSAIWPTSLALPAPAVEPDSMTVVVVDLSVAAAPVSVAGRDAGQEEAPPGYEETSVSDHDKRFSVVSMPFCGGPPGKVPDCLPAPRRSFCAHSALAGVYPLGYYDTS